MNNISRRLFPLTTPSHSFWLFHQKLSNTTQTILTESKQIKRRTTKNRDRTANDSIPLETEIVWKNKKNFGKLYSSHPEYAHISYHLGMSEIRVGKEDLGLKHLQEALEQDWQPERVTPDMQEVIKKSVPNLKMPFVLTQTNASRK